MLLAQGSIHKLCPHPSCWLGRVVLSKLAIMSISSWQPSGLFSCRILPAPGIKHLMSCTWWCACGRTSTRTACPISTGVPSQPCIDWSSFAPRHLPEPHTLATWLFASPRVFIPAAVSRISFLVSSISTSFLQWHFERVAQRFP